MKVQQMLCARVPVLTLLVAVLLQKNILGLVQGPPCRIDVEFKDEKGRRYHKTAVVKGKNGETEELPLYTNHDNIYGEVGLPVAVLLISEAFAIEERTLCLAAGTPSAL